MEADLKTLKDISKYKVLDADAICIIELFSKEDLKQEAIKWIKIIQNPTRKAEDWFSVELPEDHFLDSDYNEGEMLGAAKVLKSLFNITKEDLA